MDNFKYDKNSTRSKFNQFLDQCPEWVQEEIWGDNGLRVRIEELEQELKVAERSNRLRERMIEALADYERLASDGIYYTLEELKRHDAKVARNAFLFALNHYGDDDYWKPSRFKDLTDSYINKYVLNKGEES